MKKFVCGMICGTLISIGVQSYANGKWNNPQQSNVRIIGETIYESNLILNKMYSKMKSIDERLEMLNDHFDTK